MAMICRKMKALTGVEVLERGADTTHHEVTVVTIEAGQSLGARVDLSSADHIRINHAQGHSHTPQHL